MNDSDVNHQHTVALFRYGLIADLALLPPGCLASTILAGWRQLGWPVRLLTRS